jgi:hypothetical protein
MENVKSLNHEGHEGTRRTARDWGASLTLIRAIAVRGAFQYLEALS